MNDDDLIRRGDVRAALATLDVFGQFESGERIGKAASVITAAVSALDALPAAAPRPMGEAPRDVLDAAERIRRMVAADPQSRLFLVSAADLRTVLDFLHPPPTRRHPMNRDALIRLRDAVKAGTLEGVDLICLPPDAHAAAWKVYKRGSLDAAKALHEAVLPGWDWLLGSRSGYAHIWQRKGVGDRSTEAYDTTGCARAWLLAIIEALIAETPE